MKFTYFGHSCFQLETAGKKILFDPFISQNPLAKDIDISLIQPDYILVSHGHFDHVDDVISIAKQSGAQIISTFEIISWLNQQGIENTHPMNLGGKTQTDFGTLRMVYAAHSSVLPDGTNAGTASGFIIEANQKTCYFAGDTALTYEMKLIREWYPNISIALLPIGGNFTMDTEDALIAANFIHCDQVIGMHYDTFPPITINHEASKNLFEKAGKKLHLLPIGKQFNC